MSIQQYINTELKSFSQESSQMQMGNTVRILSADQRSHRDNIFWIVVLDGTEVAKFSLTCGLVSDDIRCLYVHPLPFWLRADKIYLTCL